MMSNRGIKLFAGNSNLELARGIARALKVSLGQCQVTKFSNGETAVTIGESARDYDVYIVQSTCGPATNDYIMELLIMSDALRRASARRITAVIPCFGYARQDKKDKSRVPISAKLIANLIETAGVDRVMSLDLHSSQIQGFFDVPMDNLMTEGAMVRWVKAEILEPQGLTHQDIVVVSPDASGAKRAKEVADRLHCDLAIMMERADGQGERLTLVGNVKGRIGILIRDMVDTCLTITRSADVLVSNGAKEVYALASHGVFSGSSVDRLEASGKIKKVIVTNSIAHPDDQVERCDRIVMMDVAPMLAEAIRRTHEGESISSLFHD